MNTTTIDIPRILKEVRRAKNRENWRNVLKLFCVLFIVGVVFCVITGTAMSLPDPVNPERYANLPEYLGVLAIVLLIIWPIHAVFLLFVLFWPFLLYFWANVQTVRQRTLLSLAQASLETKTSLANMIRAYAAGCYSPFYRRRLGYFADSLDRGNSLEQAVQENGQVFRHDIVSMIQLGGDHPDTLDSLEQVAREERDFSAVKTQSIVRVAYLGVIFSFMAFITAWLMIFILPTFEKMFIEFETTLPALTQLVMKMSNFAVCYWFLVMPVIIAVVLFVITFLILQTGAVTVRPRLLRRYFRNADSARLLRVFSVGMKHRVAVPYILDVYRRSVPSRWLKKKSLRILRRIQQGQDWIKSLRRAGFIDGPEASLLESAERTGNTPAVLGQLALTRDRMQIRKDDLFGKLVFLPCIFAFGAAVGLIVVAMFLPMVKLITDMSR